MLASYAFADTVLTYSAVWTKGQKATIPLVGDNREFKVCFTHYGWRKVSEHLRPISGYSVCDNKCLNYLTLNVLH